MARGVSNPRIAAFLVLILLLAASLRLYHLSSNPPGLFCDEASVGLDAYSILHTAHDSHGAFLPLFFESLGDYRGGVAVYSAVPFVAVLGMSELAVRLPSVVYGLLLVWVLYKFGRRLGGRRLGLLTALVAATMPWLIHYNRIGFEFSAYAFFFTLTAYLFYRGRLTWAFACAGICLYTYQPARLLIPLLVVSALVIYRKRARFSWKGPVLFAAFCVPFAVSMLNGTGLRRFEQVSVLAGHLSPAQTAIRIASNYAVQFSPHYFLDGEGTPIARHFGNGLLPILPVTLPFAIVGFLAIIFTLTRTRSQFLLAWLLLYPVAGAVTLEPPFTGRSFIGAPIAVILIAVGIARTARACARLRLERVVPRAAALAIFVNLAVFARFYFVQYPTEPRTSQFYGWQYGARDIVRYFVSVEGQYDDLMMAPAFNGPQVFIPFYAPGDCAKCSVGRPDDRFNPARRQLFAATPEYLALHREFAMALERIIYYPNGGIAFFVGKVHPQLVMEVLK
jgi:4-amino-4-deoxy-L-arabinose transferase-like glycosyltransferase